MQGSSSGSSQLSDVFTEKPNMLAGLQQWLCSDHDVFVEKPKIDACRAPALALLRSGSAQMPAGPQRFTEVFVEKQKIDACRLQQWFCPDHDVFVVKPKTDACRAPAVLDSMVATLIFFDVVQDGLITEAEFNAKMLIPWLLFAVQDSKSRH